MKLTLVRAAAERHFVLSFRPCVNVCVRACVSLNVDGELAADCLEIAALSVAEKPLSVDEVRLTFLTGSPRGVCKDLEPIQTGSEIKSLPVPHHQSQ